MNEGLWDIKYFSELQHKVNKTHLTGYSELVVQRQIENLSPIPLISLKTIIT